MKYRKKSVIIDATQWFKNGDYPKDNVFRPFEDSGTPPIVEDSGTTPIEPREGEVVRYFRHPEIRGNTICSKCGFQMHDHGWIDTLENGHNVCPGDWIIRGVNGEFYPVKNDIFLKTYEKVID